MLNEELDAGHKQDMHDTLEVASLLLDNIVRSKPNPRFITSHGEEPVNLYQLQRWEDNCTQLGEQIDKATKLVEKNVHGDDAVDAVQAAKHCARLYHNKYCK